MFVPRQKRTIIFGVIVGGNLKKTGTSWVDP